MAIETIKEEVLKDGVSSGVVYVITHRTFWGYTTILNISKPEALDLLAQLTEKLK